MTDWRTNFDDLDQQAQAEVKRQQTSAGLVASQRNPDQFARANALSDKMGLSPDLVHEDLPRFEQQDRDAGFKQLTDAHPELQGLASDARWRTLAQDQAPQLSAFADALKQAKRDRSPFATGTGTANDPLRVNKALGFGGKSSDFADVWNRAPEGMWVQREDGSVARRQIGMLEAAQGYALRGVAAAEKAVRSLPDVLALDAISGSLQAAEEAKARGDRYMNPYPAVSVGGLAPAIPNLQLQTPDQLAASAGATAAREIPGVTAREAGRNRQVQQIQDQTQGMRPASVQALDRAQTTSDTVGAIARHPIDTILSVGVESTVQFAPAIVAGLVSRNPAVVAAAAGSTSGALELSNGVSDFASRAGIDTNDPAAMRQFLQQGDNLKKALEYAKTRGAIIGSVDALTGPIGKYLHFSEQQIGHLAAREAANITAQTATGSIAGATGEAAAGAATGTFSGKAVVLEAVGELASTPGEVAGFAYDRVRTARDHQALQAVTAAAAETKLGERSLPDLESAARAVSGDQRVHLSADAARTLFQNDPAVLSDMVGGDEALAEQMATGDLSIPMAKWAATVGRMPNAEELNRHARLDPDGISQAELERLDEETAKFAVDTTDAAARATPTQPDSRQQVVDDVMGQLIATDRYSPAQAEAQAKVWGAAFGRFAERSGQDAFGLYQRYMAGIRKDGADPLSTRPFDGTGKLDAAIEAVKTGAEPKASDLFGPSLSSWIVAQGGVQDQTGELRGFDAGKQRPGMINKQGLTLDRARELAAEAGYLPADSTVPDFLDLIDRDLRKGDVFSQKEGNAAKQAFDLERQQVLDAIDQSPTLRDLPREQLAAMTNQQIADVLFGSSLDQSAIPAESEIDRLRARIAELETELRTDRLTGMRNQRAFDEDEALGWKTVAAADMDGLKKLNDAAGHEHGDAVLRAIGAVLLASERDGVRFYRRSGDEFAARFQDAAVAEQVMREVQQKLENVAIDLDVADENGNIRYLTYNGIGLTYGTGNDYQSADTAANASKRDRLAAGIREEARANGQPRRLQPRAGVEGGRGANQGSQRPADPRGLIARAADAVRSLFQAAPTAAPEIDVSPTNGSREVKIGETTIIYGVSRDGTGEVISLRTPQSKRGNGSAREAMRQFLSATDAAGLRMKLGASPLDKRTRLGTLVGFYRSLGFEMTGRRINQAGEPEMVREPQIFDPNDPSILNQQQSDGSPRGQINIFPDRRMSIQLFEKADRSTFLHESAHFFFEVMRDLATDENPEIKADFDALLSWFGAENADGLTTDHLEQFARGFESYLGEGHAPSHELRSVFAKFAAWILGVYRSLKALNVELTDDVRAVFDRMLASDDEIEAAKSRQGMQPIARDASEAKALGLTDKQWADYLADVESAAEEARLDVFNQTVGALQREQRAWWKEERAKVREEVAAKYEATPAVRAKDVLSGKQSIGGVALEAPLLGLKLDKGAIVANWGEAYLKRLGKTYAVSGGVHPDEAASMLGYASGDDLLRALANLPDTNARVDAETDAIMRERHGDPMTDGTLAEKAMDAVHGSKRIKVLERELALLSELAGTPPPPARIMRAIAERQVAGKTPRQLRPNDYLVAERRAAREALQAAAKKDFGAALKAKRQQALNVALYSAAREAQEQFGKDLRYLSRMSSTKTRAMLGKAGHDYLEQVDGLLEAVELRAASGPEVQRRQRLAEWVQRQEAAGNPVDVPVKLLAETGLTNIRDMAHADIRGVVSTIKQIEHLARSESELSLAGIKRDRHEVDAEMAASVLAAHGKVAERTGDPTRLERFKAGIADLDVGRLLPTNIARELDGYEEVGAVWSNVIAPIRTAMYEQVIPRIHKMQEAVADLYSKHYTKDELRRLDAPVWRESVGDHWSKGRILSLAMNWGSDGNREAILTQAKSRLTEAQAIDLMRTLDARDWAFVQGMVDMINDFWPEIAETQRRRTGLVPEKVESKPFAIQAEDGTMHVVRGGYFPLKYDAERSGYGATLNELDDAYNALRVGRTAKAATRNGHTIERVGSGGKTVSLGLDIATSHMRDVIRDIHLGDAVAYVHNVLHGSQFADAVIGAGKRQHLKALEVWLKDVAAGEMGASHILEAIPRFFRQNMTAAILTYKPVSAALQITGIIQTGSIIGNRATLHGVRLLLSKSWHGPNSIWNDIREKSAFMRERFGQIPDAVEAVQSQRAGALSAAHSAMIRWGYVPMARVQMIADATTWLAGERLGLKKFDGDVDKARAFADDLVMRAQSPESFFEKSAISRGTLNEKIRQTEFVKLSTMLMSYMIVKGNIQREKYQRTSLVSPQQIAKFSADMMQLFFLDAVISSLVRGGLPDDDDDDGVADDWIAYMAKEMSLGMLGTLPTTSPLASEWRGYTSQSSMEKTWAQTAELFGAWFDGNIDRKDLRNTVTVSGLAVGAPSSQINTTADALWRVHDGQDVSPLDFAVRQEKKN